MDTKIQVRLDATSALNLAELLYNQIGLIEARAKSLKVGNLFSQSHISNATKMADALERAQKTVNQGAAANAQFSQSVSKIQSVMVANTAAVNSMNAALAALTAQTQAAVAAQSQLATIQARTSSTATTTVTGQTAAFGALGRQLATVAAGYFTLRAAIDFATNSVKESIRIENLTNTLTATSGSAVQAASDLAFMRSEADRLGVSFVGSADSLIKMSVAIQGAGLSAQLSRDTFTAVSEASRRLGLSGQQTGSVFLALEQMISKGTISMQELRLQLGNALPGAFQTAARAMNVTTSELAKLVETGKLSSADFVPKFIEQLRKELPATADSIASTSAELERLGNAWQRFKQQVGDRLSPAVNAGAKLATGVLNAGPGDKELDAINKNAARIAKMRADSGLQDDFFTQFFSPGGFVEASDMMDKLEAKREAIKKKRDSEQLANLTKFPDMSTPEDEEKARRFWDTYRDLQRSALGEEERKRQEILDRYQDQLDRISKDVAGGKLSDGMAGVLKGAAGAARDATLKEFDNENSLKTFKANLEEATKTAETLRDIRIKVIPDDEARKVAEINRQFDDFRDKVLLIELGNPSAISPADYAAIESGRAAALLANSNSAKEFKSGLAEARKEAEALAEIRVKIIPDDEARKIAEINREFDTMYKSLLLLELGNPSAISPADYASLEQARQREIFSVRRPKSPAGYANEDFSALGSQRESLRARLLTETDAEAFAQTSQRIAEISQAMELKLKKNAATIREAFEFGFNETADNWGSFQQRMADVGQGVAQSMDANFTDAFASMVDGSKSVSQAFGDMARSITADVTRMLIQQLLVRSILQGIGGMFGGAGGSFANAGGGPINPAVVGHSGGRIGYETSPTNFPRFHGGGTVGDETTVVARKGEVIFTPEQIKALSSAMGGGQRQRPVNVLVAMNPDMIAEYIAANPETVVAAIGKSQDDVKRILSLNT